MVPCLCFFGPFIVLVSSPVRFLLVCSGCVLYIASVSNFQLLWAHGLLLISGGTVTGIPFLSQSCALALCERSFTFAKK